MKNPLPKLQCLHKSEAGEGLPPADDHAFMQSVMGPTGFCQICAHLSSCHKPTNAFGPCRKESDGECCSFQTEHDCGMGDCDHGCCIHDFPVAGIGPETKGGK